jgi:tetratricopeptide (TPR) repeat protein
MASIRQQLRGPAGFSWEGYAQAGTYWLKNAGPLDEALKLADRSIQMNENYQNLNLRASIVEKQGNAKAAADLRAKAQTLATEQDLAQAGFQLLRGEKKVDEALKLFQAAVVRFPESVLVQAGLAESLAGKGDKAGATAAYTKALALSKDPAQKKRIEARMAKLKEP